MKVKVMRNDVYVPRWRGNRDLPETEQIKIHFKYMTSEQEEKLSSLKPKYEDDEISFDVVVNSNAVWKECVTKIEGLSGDDGKDITSPAAVLQLPDTYSLVTEMSAFIKKGIEETDRKNSKRPSGSG